MAVEVPHLAWPFALTGGADIEGVVRAPLGQVEQDSLAEVTQSVQLLLNTTPGDRPLAPDIGVEDFAFTPTGIDPDVLATRLMDMEPRASVQVTVLGPGPDGVQNVQVRVALADDPIA